MKLIAAVSLVSLFAVPAVAQESMAQAAERQKKARNGQTKVITEADLRAGSSKPYTAASVDGAPAPVGPATPAGPASAGAPAKSDEQLRGEKKLEIEAKVKEFNDFIADTRKAMELAQAELNDLRDATFGSRRAGLQQLIDDGNKHIAEAQQSIADLHEQARRAGLPVSR